MRKGIAALVAVLGLAVVADEHGRKEEGAVPVPVINLEMFISGSVAAAGPSGHWSSRNLEWLILTAGYVAMLDATKPCMATAIKLEDELGELDDRLDMVSDQLYKQRRLKPLRWDDYDRGVADGLLPGIWDALDALSDYEDAAWAEINTTNERLGELNKIPEVGSRRPNPEEERAQLAAGRAQLAACNRLVAAASLYNQIWGTLIDTHADLLDKHGRGVSPLSEEDARWLRVGLNRPPR